MAAWHTNGVTGPHLQTLERQHTTMIFKGWLQFISCVKALLLVMFALCVIFSKSIFVLQCFFFVVFFAHFAVAVGVKVWWCLETKKNVEQTGMGDWSDLLFSNSANASSLPEKPVRASLFVRQWSSSTAPALSWFWKSSTCKYNWPLNLNLNTESRLNTFLLPHVYRAAAALEITCVFTDITKMHCANSWGLKNDVNPFHCQWHRQLPVAGIHQLLRPMAS